MTTAIQNGKFYTAPSLIAGAGAGLFNGNKVIRKGDNLFIAFARADFSANVNNIDKFECHFSQLYPNNFINHSGKPNTVNFWAGDYIVKKAIKDIQPGEEITSDYLAGMHLIANKGYDVSDWMWFKR